MGEKVKVQRIHTCNVLQADASPQQLWQFAFSGSDARPSAQQTLAADQPFPSSMAAKDWHTLWQPKVNVAWLPSDQVFLRIIHLPSANSAELVPMVELQLEKLSPLPVAQIVWSIDVLPQVSEGMQTVIVVMAARTYVEEFLGKLEGRGYLADRLELPLLHQLSTHPFEGQGLWLHPTKVGENGLCLVAWWQNGLLQNLNLLRLSNSANWTHVLGEQLTQLAWAGEMEGWLKGIQRCILVVNEKDAPEWKKLLSDWLNLTIEVIEPSPASELAATSARRLARNESMVNLLPAEYITRYRQQFIDRLWMRGLGGIIVLYILLVVGYALFVQYTYYQKYKVESQITGLSTQYTNVMQIKARVQVLQDQVNLKYAALECWKAAATLLPQELTLSDLSLQQGKTLTIHGSAPASQVNQIIEYNQAMSQYRVDGSNGIPLFSKVLPYNTRGMGANPQSINWDFACELNLKGAE